MVSAVVVLRSLHRAYPSIRPFGVVHWIPMQLNIKAVTGACKFIDGCSLELCSAIVSVVSAGICHINKVNSIAWLYRKAQPKDSIHYTDVCPIYDAFMSERLNLCHEVTSLWLNSGSWIWVTAWTRIKLHILHLFCQHSTLTILPTGNRPCIPRKQNGL